jgi:hypothetical protein
MTHWTCADCGRRFGRRNQSHVCQPAMTLDEYFAARPPYEREVFEAVLAALERVGPVYPEAVEVGVLVKRSRTFVELRPKRDAVALSFLLSRALDHPRIRRTVSASGRRGPGGRVAHFVDLRGPEDVDEQLSGWLAEAYLDSPE